jgi:hypothetical protein
MCAIRRAKLFAHVRLRVASSRRGLVTELGPVIVVLTRSARRSASLLDEHVMDRGLTIRRNRKSSRPNERNHVRQDVREPGVQLVVIQPHVDAVVVTLEQGVALERKRAVGAS